MMISAIENLFQILVNTIPNSNFAALKIFGLWS